MSGLGLVWVKGFGVEVYRGPVGSLRLGVAGSI